MERLAVQLYYHVSTGFSAYDIQMLIISNGAYGNRVRDICESAGFQYKFMPFDETNFVDLLAIEKELSANGSDYVLMSIVHCETSTGVINPIERIAPLLQKYAKGSFIFLTC